jgi:hypothetical protein
MKKLEINKVIPLAIAGLLVGAVFGGSSLFIITLLAFILYIISCFEMVKSREKIPKIIYYNFLIIFFFFSYQSVQILLFGEHENYKI